MTLNSFVLYKLNIKMSLIKDKLDYCINIYMILIKYLNYRANTV